MSKDSFVFYRDWFEALKDFDDAVRLEIYDAIMHEVFGDGEKELSSAAKIAMRFISPSIKRDRDKYNLICERRKAFGSKGGVAKASKSQYKVAKGGKRWQKVASVSDNDNDNDNDMQDTNVSMSINKEEDTDVSKKKSSVFVPPSVEEVAEYIKQKGYHFNAQSFVDYYEADDWHYGKGANRKKVSNWKRCCSTWEKKIRNNSSDMFAQPVSVQLQSSEATKKYYAYHIGFDTEAKADAFFEEQEKIREGIYNGTYKVTVRNVDDWLAQGNALKVVDGVVYDYDL